MDFEKALLNPAAIYHHPDEVKNDSSLTLTQKLTILQRWELDARELETAEEENMGGGAPSLFREVCLALHELESAKARHER